MAQLIEFDSSKKRIAFFNPKVPMSSESTPQQQVAQTFIDHLENVEDFAILARTKDRKALLFTCIDTDLNVWTFMDAFKVNTINLVVQQLFGEPVDPNPVLA